MDNLKRITLNPARCGLDLGDGSERAEYVNQDYILNVLGRPHRNIGTTHMMIISLILAVSAEVWMVSRLLR